MNLRPTPYESVALPLSYPDMWHAQQELNPRPVELEATALPSELYAYDCVIMGHTLTSYFVDELGNSVVGGVGFEPTWLNTTDLQSVPIDRSGNHQKEKYCSLWYAVVDLNYRPHLYRRCALTN